MLKKLLAHLTLWSILFYVYNFYTRYLPHAFFKIKFLTYHRYRRYLENSFIIFVSIELMLEGVKISEV